MLLMHLCVQSVLCTKTLPIILALFLMLLPPYYAQNYAGIVGSSLPLNWIIYTIQIVGYAKLGVTNVIMNSQTGVQILAFYSMISHEISLAKSLLCVCICVSMCQDICMLPMGTGDLPDMYT